MTPREAAVLPAPLTPPDCDLQDFKFMPLDVARLRDSDMASEQTPEENWAAVLLWAAAWHQVPAGSMPDSDNWIAKAAGYLSRGRVDPHWKDVKAGAMRGFVLCSDGRWYHPVVCEKANESWLAKLRQRLKTECNRIKKHNERHGTRLPFPDFESWFNAGCPTGQPLPVPGDNPQLSLATDGIVASDMPPLSFATDGDVTGETPSKGQRQGQRQGQGQLTSNDNDDITDGGYARATSATLPPREDPPPSNDPAIAVAVALRKLGVDATFTHPAVQDWTKREIAPEVLRAAVDLAREQKGPNAKIAPNYLVPIVEKLLNPPPMAESKPHQVQNDWAWKRTPQGIEAKGRELGMFARGTENHQDFAVRIQKELDKRKGGQP
jgi:hypothetical protein